jgi:hypothetical protein
MFMCVREEEKTRMISLRRRRNTRFDVYRSRIHAAYCTSFSFTGKSVHVNEDELLKHEQLYRRTCAIVQKLVEYTL